MKWGSGFALLTALTPLLCHAQGFPGLDSVFGEDVAARVLSREGQVSIYRDNTNWAIDTGDIVRVHQMVVTGEDGHAVFRVSDGSTFEVFPNSQVTFRANPGSLRDLLDVSERDPGKGNRGLSAQDRKLVESFPMAARLSHVTGWT